MYMATQEQDKKKQKVGEFEHTELSDSCGCGTLSKKERDTDLTEP
jgi:hypothetical protein